MKEADRIIVLHSTAFSEKSLVIHCLSRQYGRRSFLVGNISRSMAFFQPMNILDCEIAANPKSSLFKASGFVSAHPLAGIRSSFGKNAISMFMAEILFRGLKEGIDEPGLFEWMESEILLLDALEGSYANFHIRFLLDFAAAMGFSPSMEALLPFLEESSAVAGRFLTGTPADSMLIPLTGEQRSLLCARLLKYLEFHLESALNIRSLAILQEIQTNVI